MAREGAGWLLITIIIVVIVVIMVLISRAGNKIAANEKDNKSSFGNDEIVVDDSYENKHLFEQKVFQMLTPKNKKVYLNLPEDEKNMFLSDVEKNK